MAKSKNETKSELISVRFYPSEVRKIEKFSKTLKMSLPDYVRYAVQIDFDKTTAQRFEKKKADYKKLLVTARKMLFVIQKLCKVVNFQMETGLKKEVILDIRKRLKEIEKQKESIKNNSE